MARRFLEIDALKAFGIVTVVLIHGLRPPWDPSLSALESWLGHVTRFAVPAFLLASGFLYATGDPVSPAITLRRLRRVAIPYLFVSAAAQGWWLWRGVESPTGRLCTDLLFGASFGPFYYVFVIFGLILVTPLLARLPARSLAPLAVALIAVQWAVDVTGLFGLGFFWHIRNPLLWWSYFLTGWLLRQHYDAVRRWISSRRVALVTGLLVAVALLTAASGAGGPRLAIRTAAWLNIYAILSLILALFCGRERASVPLRVLSEATYAIYLCHLFFVYGARLIFPLRSEQAGLLPIAVPWAAGLLGSLALIALLRAVLGERSRDVIGA